MVDLILSVSNIQRSSPLPPPLRLVQITAAVLLVLLALLSLAGGMEALVRQEQLILVHHQEYGIGLPVRLTKMSALQLQLRFLPPQPQHPAPLLRIVLLV